MLKRLDKIIKRVKFNKSLFVFLTVLVSLGIASGAIFSSVLSASDKALVSDYLNNFLLNVKDNRVASSSSFFSVSIFTLGFTLLIWLFGLSVIGITFILPFLFIKSFILGFSVGSIFLNFKLKGVIISFVYIIPHQVINILIYILISSYAITVSTKLIRSFKNRKIFDFKRIMNQYTFILVFSEVVLLFSVLYEIYALPYIMKIVVKLIN